MKVRIGARIYPDTLEKLEKWSASTGVTKSQIVSFILKNATIDDLNQQWLSDEFRRSLEVRRSLSTPLRSK